MADTLGTGTFKPENFLKRLKISNPQRSLAPILAWKKFFSGLKMGPEWLPLLMM